MDLEYLLVAYVFRPALWVADVMRALQGHSYTEARACSRAQVRRCLAMRRGS